ncbi:MAG: urease accessory protein UreE [Steroidobacteraceae bacterium]
MSGVLLQISRRLPVVAAADGEPLRLVLPYETRSRSRFRARLSDGQEVGVILERGQVLRGGDWLQMDDGRAVRVDAAPETVSTVQAADPWQLARAAYHLGNRHVALQVGAGWLRYQHDHVLDEMVRGLGLPLEVGQAPFEPEPGAYYSAAGAHSHQHLLHHHG